MPSMRQDHRVKSFCSQNEFIPPVKKLEPNDRFWSTWVCDKSSVLLEDSMTAVHEKFTGLFIPYVTPFNHDGSLDRESLGRLTQHFAALPGVAGLVSCARIGESPVLSIQEKRQVYEVCGKIARDAGKVHIATIAPQSTDEAVALMKDLEDLAVDGVMIFPPLLFSWGKVDNNLKVRFF